MQIEVGKQDERQVEQVVAVLKLNGYRVTGKVLKGRVVLVGVKNHG